MESFNPIKSIKSRYSLNNMTQTNYYGHIQITSTASTTTNSGIVWVPYTIATTTDPDYERRYKRKQRLDKLNKLNENW